MARRDGIGRRVAYCSSILVLILDLILVDGEWEVEGKMGEGDLRRKEVLWKEGTW
jgi:hypothetical protein